MKKLDKFDIFIILSTVICFFVVASLPFKTLPFGDNDFHPETKLFADYIKGNVPSGQLIIEHAPGPVIFFLLPYLIVKSGSPDIDYWHAAIIWSAIAMIFSMLLIRRAGSLMFNDMVGKMAVFFFLIFPIHIYYCLGIGAEQVAFFSIALFLYGWARWKKKSYPRFLTSSDWWTMNFGLFFLILNRQNAGLILIFLLVVVYIMYLKEKNTYWLVGKGLIGSAFTVLISGFIVSQSLKLLPGNSGKNTQEAYFFFVAHEGSFQFRKEPFDWRYWQASIRGDSRDFKDWEKRKDSIVWQSRITGKQKSTMFAQDILKNFKEKPFAPVYQFFLRAIYGHLFVINSIHPAGLRFAGIPGIAVYLGLHILINILYITLLVFAFLFMFRERGNLLEYWPLWLPWFSLVIFNSLVYMEPRYLFPSMPGIFLMAASQIASTKFSKKWFGKREYQGEHVSIP
jgi:hypothetical protein